MSDSRFERMKGKIIDFRLRPPTGPYRIFFTDRVVTTVNRLLGHPVPRSYTVSTEQRPDADDRALAVLLEEMDRSGVRTGIMNGRHSVNRPIPVHIEDPYMAEISKQSGRRLLGLAGVNFDDPMPTILAKLDTAVRDLGMVGVCMEPGLARTPMYADDERLYPIYEKVAELKVPLLFMSGPLAGPDISHTDPVRFDRVARRYSSMPVILGHGCYPYVNEAIALAFKSEVTGLMNVYVSPDVYMFAAGGEAYTKAVNWIPNRFLFASAYSFCGVDTAVAGTLKLGIEDEALEMYMYKNAEALLGPHLAR